MHFAPARCSHMLMLWLLLSALVMQARDVCWNARREISEPRCAPHQRRGECNSSPTLRSFEASRDDAVCPLADGSAPGPPRTAAMETRQPFDVALAHRFSLSTGPGKRHTDIIFSKPF